MKTWKRIATALVTAVALTMTPAMAQEAGDKVGKVLDISTTNGGKLMTNRNTEGDKFYQAYPEMPAHMEEKMTTDDKTTATISFAVGGTGVISKNAEVVILKNQVKGDVIKVKKGALWAKIDKQNSKLQIQTAGGTMGIEGTEFFVVANPDGTTKLVMVEGRVAVGERTYGVGEATTLQGGAGADSDRFYEGDDIAAARRSAFEAHQEFREIRSEVNSARYFINSWTGGLIPYSGGVNQALNYVSQGLAFASDPGGYAKNLALGRFRSEWNRTMKRTVSTPFGSKSVGPDFPEPDPVDNLRVDKSPLVFRWDPSRGAAKYSVALTTGGKNPESVWYTVTENKDHVEYPAYAPKLDPSKSYRWTVIPLNSEGGLHRYELDLPGFGEPAFLGDRSVFSGVSHTPSYGTVSDAKGGSSFEWSDFENAGSYKVKIAADEAMNDVRWAGSAKDPGYTIPPEARALESGTYYLSVDAFDPFGFLMATSPATSFTL